MSKEVRDVSEAKESKQESYTPEQREKVSSAADKIRGSWYGKEQDSDVQKTSDSKIDNKTDSKTDNKQQTEVKEEDYSRPTHWRKGMRDQAWENAKDSHGRVRDPVTGQYMSKDNPWHMGHKPGYEFYKHQASAKERGISRKQFLDEYYNVDHYRPELPKSNMSHKGESKSKSLYDYPT